MGDYSQLFTDIRQGLLQFEQRVDNRFASIDSRFASIDSRFASIDARFTAVEMKIDAGLAAVTGEIATLRRDLASQFRWTAGIMLTGLVAIAAAMIAR